MLSNYTKFTDWHNSDDHNQLRRTIKIVCQKTDGEAVAVIDSLVNKTVAAIVCVVFMMMESLAVVARSETTNFQTCGFQLKYLFIVRRTSGGNGWLGGEEDHNEDIASGRQGRYFDASAIKVKRRTRTCSVVQKSAKS